MIHQPEGAGIAETAVNHSLINVMQIYTVRNGHMSARMAQNAMHITCNRHCTICICSNNCRNLIQVQSLTFSTHHVPTVLPLLLTGCRCMGKVVNYGTLQEHFMVVLNYPLFCLISRLHIMAVGLILYMKV